MVSVKTVLIGVLDYKFADPNLLELEKCTNDVEKLFVFYLWSILDTVN